MKTFWPPKLATAPNFPEALSRRSHRILQFLHPYPVHVNWARPLWKPTPPLCTWFLPLFPANLLHGEGHGAELVVNWKPISRWTLSPGFSYLQMHFHAAPTSTDTTSVNVVEGSSPREQAQLRSHVELRSSWAWDAVGLLRGTPARFASAGLHAPGYQPDLAAADRTVDQRGRAKSAPGRPSRI